MLPHISELAGFIDKPLPENLKLPLLSLIFNAYIDTNFADSCKRDDLKILFKESETECGIKLNYEYARPILSSPPESSSSEDAFINFWDENIRCILTKFVPSSKVIRNSSRHMSTSNKRPDFGLLLSKVCPFRGEETSENSQEDPKSELSEKLVWTYGDAPYVLGKDFCIFVYHLIIC